MFVLISSLTDDGLKLDGSNISISKTASNPTCPVGTGLIREIIGNDKTATIGFSKSTERTTTSFEKGDPGTGTVALKKPYTNVEGKDSTTRVCRNDFNSPKTGYAPAKIIIGHELIHSYHILSGTNGKDEEDRTVGLGVYSNDMYTENALRREHGLEIRVSY